MKLKRGTLNFVMMEHDADCPGLERESMLACTCQPNFRLANEDEFISRVQRSRAQRRAAERAAEKAVRKARRT